MISSAIGSQEAYSEETMHRKHIMKLWNTVQLNYMKKEWFGKLAHCQPISKYIYSTILIQAYKYKMMNNHNEQSSKDR
mgnify:CR=1 FL=1